MKIIYKKPRLYKTAASGKINTVDIYTDGEVVYRKTGDKISEVEVIPKANRSLEEQAILMTDSEFNKKIRSGYREEKEVIEVRPMLAKVFKESYVEWPAGLSPKLDGVRCMALWDDGVVLLSRTGKEFFFKELIRSHLKEIFNEFGKSLVLDGELYIHDTHFSDIMRLVSPKKKAPANEDDLEYHIFDIVNKNTYEVRMNLLEKIEASYHELFKPAERVLKFVFYDDVDDLDDVERLHDVYAKKGYEGVMIRNLKGKYRSGFRSSDLLKYKKFEDDEFEIVDFTQGTGNDKGAIIFIVLNNDDDRTFNVKPKLPVEERKRMYKKGEEYIGKMYTVRYQPSPQGSNNDLPRFPVGICVRDYE